MRRHVWSVAYPRRTINLAVIQITGGGPCDPDQPDMSTDPTHPAECGVSDHRRGGFDHGETSTTISRQATAQPTTPSTSFPETPFAHDPRPGPTPPPRSTHTSPGARPCRERLGVDPERLNPTGVSFQSTFTADRDHQDTSGDPEHRNVESCATGRSNRTTSGFGRICPEAYPRRASLHVFPRSTSMSCGKPSARSPTMLRWTAHVPPPTVNAGEKRYP